ncbi:MAG: GntR family transcriptional regulator, transcriptional repressor for pyruvate dehydrogenase complex [Solirubrobacteraceae bacterium]
MDKPLITSDSSVADHGAQAGRRADSVPFDVVPIERVDVFQTVLKRLEDWIQRSDLRPGDRLPAERELARALGVSRPSLRQALKVLISLNRIEQRHGSGTYITTPVKDPIAAMLLADQGPEALPLAEIVDIRSAVDTLVVRQAAQRMTDEHLAELRAWLERRSEELESEPAAPGSLDLRFEAQIARVAGSPVLCRLQAAVHDMHLHAWAERGVAPADLFRLHEEHFEILGAMESGDWERAEALMYMHTNRHPPDGA